MGERIKDKWRVTVRKVAEWEADVLVYADDLMSALEEAQEGIYEGRYKPDWADHSGDIRGIRGHVQTRAPTPAPQDTPKGEG